MNLTVDYVQATPEDAKGAIEMLAVMYRNVMEKHRAEARGLLPATSQRYPTEGLEPTARNKRGIPGEFVTREKGKRHLSRRRNASRLLIDSNQLPQTNPTGNEFAVERPLKPIYLSLPDLQTAPIGVRLRFLRKRRGLTVLNLAKATGISHGTISRLERGRSIFNVAAVGKLLAFFRRDLSEAFQGGQDPHDQFTPVSDFASWLRNFRVRKGLQQVELARLLGMSSVSICRYERHVSEPQAAVLKRFKRVFKLNGELDRFLMGRL